MGLRVVMTTLHSSHQALTRAENVDIGTHWHRAQSLQSEHLECNVIKSQILKF